MGLGGSSVACARSVRTIFATAATFNSKTSMVTSADHEIMLRMPDDAPARNARSACMRGRGRVNGLLQGLLLAVLVCGRVGSSRGAWAAGAGLGCGPRLRAFPSVRSSRRDECGGQARLPRHVFALGSHDGIDGHGRVGLNQFDDSQQGAGVMPLVELATGPWTSLTRPPRAVRGNGSRRRVTRSRRA